MNKIDSNANSGQVYMVLNAAQVKNGEYKNFQTGNGTVEETDNCKHVKATKKSKAWITIIILMTVLGVFTFISLAVSALGFRRSSNSPPNDIQFAIAESRKIAHINFDTRDKCFNNSSSRSSEKYFSVR
jgi:hypothetical protein